MSTIQSQSEMCRKAVAWIDEQQRDRPEAKQSTLLEEAAQRFNLGPADCEFLQRLFRKSKESDG